MNQSKKDILQLEAEINVVKRTSKELTEANFNKLIQETWDCLKRIVAEDSIDVSMLEVLGQKAGLFDLYARESEVANLVFNEQGRR